MWPFSRRKWILVIGYSNSEQLFTDIKCISTKRDECVNKAYKEIREWIDHKQKVFGGHLINNYMNLDISDCCKFREKLYEKLLSWTEDFQDTSNLELTWKSSHLEIFKMSVRIFSSESDFIKF